MPKMTRWEGTLALDVRVVSFSLSLFLSQLSDLHKTCVQ